MSAAELEDKAGARLERGRREARVRGSKQEQMEAAAGPRVNARKRRALCHEGTQHPSTRIARAGGDIRWANNPICATAVKTEEVYKARRPNRAAEEQCCHEAALALCRYG